MIELTSKEIEAVHSTIEMELHPCASQERASEIASFVRGLLLESLKYDTGHGHHARHVGDGQRIASRREAA